MLVLAEAEFMKGKRTKAEQEANEALSKFKEMDDKDGQAKAMYIIDRFKTQVSGMATAEPLAIEASADAGGEQEVGAVSAQAVAKVGMKREAAEALAKEIAIMSIGSAEELDMDSPLMDLGLDSLASVSFREQLIKESGLKLPTSLVFDYPSLNAIADHMVETSLE